MATVSLERPAPSLPAPGAPARRPLPALLGLAAVTLLAGGLRFWGLGRQGIWYDEAVTASLLRGSPGRLLALLPHSESTPPLYYLLAWGWERVFGASPEGLRSLSAVAGTAAVPVAFLAGRRLAGARVGLVAALLVAADPLLVWYAQEARAYALLVLLVALSLWLLARARAQPGTGRLLAWAACACAAVATHYFAAFAIAPEALLLLADRRSPLRSRLLAAALPAATAVALLLALAVGQSAKHYWFLTLPLGFRAVQAVRELMVGFSPPAGRAPSIAAAALVAAGLALAAWRGERRAAAVALAVGGGALGLPLLAALAGADYFNGRNVIGAAVPLAVALACGLGARRAGRAGLAVAAALAVLGVGMVVELARDPLAQRAHWRPVAAALAIAGGPHAILIRGASTWLRPLAYALPGTAWMPVRGALVSEIDVLRRIPTARDCPGATWWGAVCDMGARPAAAGPPARGFKLVSRRAVAGFEVSRFRAPRPVRVYAEAPLERPGVLPRRPHVALAP